MKPLRRLLPWTALALVLLVAALGAAWHESTRVLARPLALDAPRIFTIASGSSVAAVARQLNTEGWLPEPRLLTWRARVDGRARALKAGTYEAVPGDTLDSLLARIVAGQTKRFAVTFIEGCRFADMRATLAAAPYLVHTLDDADDPSLAADLGLPTSRPEGWFFPATYDYEAGTEDRAILRRAHRRMTEELARQWEARAADLPLQSPYEALVLASIIEKETGAAAERAEIAGVFARRLQRGMRLQTDPTVIYGLGTDFDGDLRRADLTRDTPYNTYTRAGLPPTPIAMPGAAALAAAVQPAAGEALYFVARGDGRHHFSGSLGEHNAAVRRYQLERRR